MFKKTYDRSYWTQICFNNLSLILSADGYIKVIVCVTGGGLLILILTIGLSVDYCVASRPSIQGTRVRFPEEDLGFGATFLLLLLCQ